MNATPKHVYQAIVAVTSALAKEGIAKDKTNTGPGKYKFRGIDDVYNALSHHLAENSLVIFPRVLNRESVERRTANGGAMFYVTLEVEFDFVSAIDGTSHTAKTFGEAMDASDKATNKAMSAAYKYAMFQTFCIPTEGELDADAFTPEVRHHESQPANSRPAAQPQPQVYSQIDFDQNLPAWREAITAGKTTADTVVAKINGKGLLLSDQQLDTLYAIKAPVPQGAAA